jgi:DNA invertase Pin-like site-specific DNA recombinase
VRVILSQTIPDGLVYISRRNIEIPRHVTVTARIRTIPTEGAWRFMLQQMAAVAELEAGFISARTKAALVAAKKRGVKLGGYRAGGKLTAKARKSGQEANARKAAERATDLAPLIAELQAAGKTSLRAIAEGLHERGIPTARGADDCSAVQVARVLARGGSSEPQRPFADLSAAA